MTKDHCTNRMEYVQAAKDAGWHQDENGHWVADDQSEEDGYPDISYINAEQLCKEEGIMPYATEQVQDQKDRYVIYDIQSCIVKFKRVVLADDMKDAFDAFQEDRFAPEDNLDTEILDYTGNIDVEVAGRLQDELQEQTSSPQAPSCCPNCGCVEVDQQNAEPCGLDTLSVPSKCTECGHSWEEIFKFKEVK